MIVGPTAIRTRRWEGAPVFSIRVWLRGGSRTERHPGAALAAGRLLTEGTTRRDWRQLAQESESRGLEISSGAGLEQQWLALDGLSRDWELGLEWAAELVADSAFPEDRCAWVRRQAAAELDAQRDHPELETAWAFLEHLYHPHPAARPLEGTKEALAALDPAACRAHHERAMASGLIVTVVGEIDEELATAKAEELFDGGREADRQAAAVDEPPAPEGLPDSWRRLELRSSEQAHLFCGRRTVARADGARPALRLLGVILGAGDGLHGRLPGRLRERDGLAYDVGVETVAGAGLDPGRAAVHLGVAPGAVDRAAAAIRQELERLLDDGVTAEELDDARSYLLGREPFRRETARQWSVLLAAAELYGEPLERHDWLREQLRDVDPTAVRTAARAYLAPADLRWTVGVPAVGSS